MVTQYFREPKENKEREIRFICLIVLCSLVVMLINYKCLNNLFDCKEGL